MDIKHLIPAPDTLPVGPLWFEILLLGTFILHLVVMNTMLGTAIIALAATFNKKKGRPTAGIAGEVSTKLPVSIAFTINTGVAPLLFVQMLYGHLFYTSSVLMAVAWLSVVALLMILYYGAYLNSYRVQGRGGASRPLLAVTVLAMLGTGFILANNMTLMLTPEKWPRYFDNPTGTLLNLTLPSLYPRFLHFVAASIAVGGLGLAHLAAWKNKNDPTSAAPEIKTGLHWFMAATTCQVPVGLWFLLALPERIRALFLGGSLPAMVLLAAGIACAAIAVRLAFKEKLWPCTLALLAAVTAMALVRHLVRAAWLAPVFNTADLKVVPQYSPLLLFILVLLLALGLIAYILKLAFFPQAPRPDRPEGGAK